MVTDWSWFSISNLILRFTRLELRQELENVKTQNAIEVDKLNRKLKWYSENQKLVDADVESLNDKRNEIKELRTLVERLESENKKQKQEKNANVTKKRSEQTKVQDLQRQVNLLFHVFD